MSGQDDLELLDALAMVADDKTASIDTRLAALRRLSGALFGRLVLTHLEELNAAPVGAHGADGA